jgi:hypothetical protein
LLPFFHYLFLLTINSFGRVERISEKELNATRNEIGHCIQHNLRINEVNQRLRRLIVMTQETHYTQHNIVENYPISKDNHHEDWQEVEHIN